MVSKAETGRRFFGKGGPFRLTLAGLVLTAVGAGCDTIPRKINFSGNVDIAPQGVVTGTESLIGAKAAETPIARAATGTTPAAKSPEPTPTIAMVERGGVRVFNIPDKASNVELAKGEFKNTLGQGMEAFAAEPGWLLVGPDFESRSRNNPWGDNPGGWETMWSARGHIRPFSPDTQHSFVNDPPASYLASEGGWVVFSAPKLTFEVNGMRVEVPAENGVNNLIIIRGLYPDGSKRQDSLRNSGVRMVDYEPAATLGMRNPGGSEAENSAFWSEGQFKQVVATSHRSDSNCGLDGCSRVRVTYLDLNTKAFGVWEQSAGRGESLAEAIRNAGQDWVVEFKNY